MSEIRCWEDLRIHPMTHTSTQRQLARMLSAGTLHTFPAWARILAQAARGFGMIVNLRHDLAVFSVRSERVRPRRSDKA